MSAIGKDFNGQQVPFKVVDAAGEKVPVFTAHVFDTIIDEPNATTTYICEASIGSASSDSVWRVQRVSISGTVKTIRFAGTGAFDQIADNRASLTYA